MPVLGFGHHDNHHDSVYWGFVIIAYYYDMLGVIITAYRPPGRRLRGASPAGPRPGRGGPGRGGGAGHRPGPGVPVIRPPGRGV